MMNMPRRLLTPRSWLRLPRRTARLRLTALYGGLFTLAGAGLLGITYWLVERATVGAIEPNADVQRSVVQLGCNIPDRLVHIALDGRGAGVIAAARPLSWTRAFPAPGPPLFAQSLAGSARLAPSLRSLVIPQLLLPRNLTFLPARCQRLLNFVPAALTQVHTVDLHTLLIESAIALAVMAGLALVLGWFVAGRVLGPLRSITATARRISASSLNERLALTGRDDEFKELADTLDDLFARLEASFQAQRNFVANASHELRTPLTLDRTLLQVTLRDPKASVEEWRATGQEILESSQQQERLLEALLTLASSEGGLSCREPVDLAQVAEARLLAISDEMASRGISTETSVRPAPVLGDPALIERLTANLLDNAVRHNVPHGRIEVTTRTSAGRAVLSIASTGPRVPPAELDRLFQPFQRLGRARASSGSGNGLGLSIVKAIAAAHGAAITAQAPRGGGLRIEVSFPVSDRGGGRQPAAPAERAAVPGEPAAASAESLAG